MAATGKTPILLYGSTTATNVPVAGNLTNSSDGCEIAINVADKNLFFKDSTNAVNTVPIRQSSGSSDGWLSSTNWTTFNSKQAAYTNLTSIGSLANATGWLYNNGSGTFSYSTPSASDVGAVPTSRTVSTTAPLAGGGALSSNLTLSITQATTSTSGYLSSIDWNTFNGKVSSQWVTSGSDVYYDTGNVGIGTTPVAWGSSYRALEIKSGGFAVMSTANDYEIFCNGYYNGSNYKYVTTNPATLCYSNAGAITWYTAPSGTANNNITWTTLGGWGSNTNFTVSAGNLVIGTSGKGIDFSATAGTGTSELLADYEEGTFTPTIAGTTTSGTGTYTIQIGRYTKIGQKVFFNIYLAWTNLTGAVGVLVINGLPYTSGNVTNNLNPVTTISDSVVLTAGYIMENFVFPNSTQVAVRQYPTGGGAAATVALDTAGTIIVAGSYDV